MMRNVFKGIHSKLEQRTAISEFKSKFQTKWPPYRYPRERLSVVNNVKDLGEFYDIVEEDAKRYKELGINSDDILNKIKEFKEDIDKKREDILQRKESMRNELAVVFKNFEENTKKFFELFDEYINEARNELNISSIYTFIKWYNDAVNTSNDSFLVNDTYGEDLKKDKLKNKLYIFDKTIKKYIKEIDSEDVVFSNIRKEIGSWLKNSGSSFLEADIDFKTDEYIRAIEMILDKRYSEKLERLRIVLAKKEQQIDGKKARLAREGKSPFFQYLDVDDLRDVSGEKELWAYKILEVEPNATSGDIKRAHRLLVKKYHPDVNGKNEENEKKIREVNEAYDILVKKIREIN